MTNQSNNRQFVRAINIDVLNRFRVLLEQLEQANTRCASDPEKRLVVQQVKNPEDGTTMVLMMVNPSIVPIDNETGITDDNVLLVQFYDLDGQPQSVAFVDTAVNLEEFKQHMM